MSNISTSEAVDAAVRRNTAIQWGWPLFLAGSLGGAITSFLLYWWVVNMSVGAFRFWADTFVCIPLYLISCVGFFQIVSGTTINRLVLGLLAWWRRLLILAFVEGAISFLISFTYFLFYMSPVPPINGDM